MYAIIQTGGKQYRVKQGDIIDVELLETNDNVVEFKEVLFVNDGKAALVGKPHVPGFLVKGEFIGEAKGPKVVSFKYKRRKNSHTKHGHRQKYARVKITGIEGKGESSVA